MREEEIEDNFKYTSLESYLDGKAINMRGETDKGLGAKPMKIIFISLNKLKCLHFQIGLSFKHLHFILRKQAFKIYFHFSAARQITLV